MKIMDKLQKDKLKKFWPKIGEQCDLMQLLPHMHNLTDLDKQPLERDYANYGNWRAITGNFPGTLYRRKNSYEVLLNGMIKLGHEDLVQQIDAEFYEQHNENNHHNSSAAQIHVPDSSPNRSEESVQVRCPNATQINIQQGNNNTMVLSDHNSHDANTYADSQSNDGDDSNIVIERSNNDVQSNDLNQSHVINTRGIVMQETGINSPNIPLQEEPPSLSQNITPTKHMDSKNIDLTDTMESCINYPIEEDSAQRSYSPNYPTADKEEQETKVKNVYMSDKLCSVNSQSTLQSETLVKEVDSVMTNLKQLVCTKDPKEHSETLVKQIYCSTLGESREQNKTLAVPIPDSLSLDSLNLREESNTLQDHSVNEDESFVIDDSDYTFDNYSYPSAEERQYESSINSFSGEGETMSTSFEVSSTGLDATNRHGRDNPNIKLRQRKNKNKTRKGINQAANLEDKNNLKSDDKTMSKSSNVCLIFVIAFVIVFGIFFVMYNYFLV